MLQTFNPTGNKNILENHLLTHVHVSLMLYFVGYDSVRVVFRDYLIFVNSRSLSSKAALKVLHLPYNDCVQQTETHFYAKFKMLRKTNFAAHVTVYSVNVKKCFKKVLTPDVFLR